MPRPWLPPGYEERDPRGCSARVANRRDDNLHYSSALLLQLMTKRARAVSGNAVHAGLDQFTGLGWVVHGPDVALQSGILDLLHVRSVQREVEVEIQAIGLG